MLLSHFRKLSLLYLLAAASAFLSFDSSAQSSTRVSGVVTDAKTKEPIPFATVTFTGNKVVGATTDLDGKYALEISSPVKTIDVAFIGYKTVTMPIKAGTKQVINVRLEPVNEVLETAMVKAEKVRYSNKNNPAVDLLRKIIEHKYDNRIKSHDYYQYSKYEKLELALNNFKDSAGGVSGFLKKADFIFGYVDTSDLTGQRILPVYFRETASDVYYRRSPESTKEYVKAERSIDIHHFVDMTSVNAYLNSIFAPIDLYDNEVMILQVKFMSPLSPFAPNFFKYHILDTVNIEGVQCSKLSFFPRNAGDLAFSGDIYVLTDSSYIVKRIDLRTPRNTGINFIRNFALTHTYNKTENNWCLTDDNMSVEFVMAESNKGSLLGTRKASLRNYIIDKPAPDPMYKGVANVVRLQGYDQQPPMVWETLRHDTLSKREAGVFIMIDSLKQVPIFKHTLNALALIFSGYTQVGKVDIGPVVSFFSFNSLEGARFRFGGKTNARFDPHLFFAAYGAVGTKDKRFKYNGTAMYSVSKKKQHPWEFPMNLFSVSYEYDLKIPGQAFLYGSGDKLLLSFRRGPAEKMNYERKVELKWQKEYESGFSFNPGLKWLNQDPQEGLHYFNGAGERTYTITTSQASLGLRYAPNERFYQDQMNRFPIDPSRPIFGINQVLAIPNVLNGDYLLNRTDAHFDKRFWIGGLGYADVWLKAGRIWNTGVPFPLLIIPQANQNYAYQDEAYNLMNFKEFVVDRFASANISYCFNGMLLNRVPLVRKLKLREFITYKAYWGSLGEKNNPANDPNLFQLPSGTYLLDSSTPYMEASLAIDNIFKFLRIDLIRRITYLNNSESIKWGVGFRVRPGF